MIEEGTFTIFDNSGKELARVSKGSCFGELALLHQVPLFIPCSSYWATCRPRIHVHTQMPQPLLRQPRLEVVFDFLSCRNCTLLSVQM